MFHRVTSLVIGRGEDLKEWILQKKKTNNEIYEIFPKTATNIVQISGTSCWNVAFYPHNRLKYQEDAEEMRKKFAKARFRHAKNIQTCRASLPFSSLASQAAV